MFVYPKEFHYIHIMLNRKRSLLDPTKPLIDIQSQDALLRRLLLRQNLQEFVLSQIALSQQMSRGFGGNHTSPSAAASSSQSTNEVPSVPRSYDNRPSVYNRRISSEQAHLPDGRLCTRVPARRWSKRDSDWANFQFTCDFCPMFGDVRKYRRKAELVRHQALHFPEQARKFKCGLCNYSATRNEYLKSHMSNRHGIVHPKDCKRTKHTSSSPLPSLDNGLSFPSMLSLTSSELPGCSSTPELNTDSMRQQHSEGQANKHGMSCSFKRSFSDLNSQQTVSSELSQSSPSLEHEPVKIEIMEN